MSNSVLPLSFFDSFNSLTNKDIDLLYNKNLLNKLIKNPKNEMGNHIVDLSNDEVKELKDLRKAFKKKGQYRYTNENRYGRVYHNSNIQFINSVLRKTVLYDNYFEADIINCQPTLLQQLCKFHNLECKNLNLFVKNRDKIIDSYLHGGAYSRDEVKEKLATVFFNEKCYDPEFIELHKEVLSITNTLKKYYNDVYSFSKEKNKVSKNPDTSFLAILLQTIENRIITVSYSFLEEKSIKCGLVLHDGLYIRNDKSIEELKPIIKDMEKFIKDNFYDFEIQFKLKDFTTETLHGHEELKDDVSSLTDKELTDAYFEFTKDIGSRIILVNNEFWVCDDNSVWKQGNDAYLKSILDTKEFNEYLLVKYSNKINFDTAREWSNLFKYLKMDIRFHKNHLFLFNDKPEVLAFSNKKCIILNKFNKDTPFTVRELLPNDYTTMTTNFPLDESLLDVSYKSYCKEIITNQFQDIKTAETYLTIMGLSLYGELLVKNFFINKGCGDNGRSFFSNLISKVFGDYHGTFNSDFFISKDNDGDIKCPEGIANKDKRLITINEPSSSNNFRQTTWATEKIKTFTGNDIIQARNLSANDIVNYKNRATILNNLNTRVDFKIMDGATRDRVIVIPQDTQFVDEVILPHHRPKIMDDLFLNTDKFKFNTMMVLLDYWGVFVNNDLKLELSQQIKDFSDEMLNDKLDLFISQYYVKTTSKEDYITLEDLYEHYLFKVPQGDFTIKKNTFKEKLTSKKYTVKKINRNDEQGNRVNKLAVLFLTSKNSVFEEIDR